MSKVSISPLLNSLFRSSDRMTKEEATTLCSVLSEVGNDDVTMSLAQSTVVKNGCPNYVIIHGENVVDDVDEVLKSNGWNIVDFQNRGLEGKWFYFVRQ